MFKFNRFLSLLFLIFVSLSRPLVPMNHVDELNECVANEDCIICSEECNRENDFITPCCHHFFHFDCLEEWVDQNPTCPMCRAPLTPADLQREYENQMRVREERRRLAIEEEERQIQEAIRISLEEENQRQAEQELARRIRMAPVEEEVDIEDLITEQERIIEALNISKIEAITELNRLRLERQNLIRDRLQRRCLELPDIQQQQAQELLHQAILNDSIEEIREVVHVGVDVNQERDGRTPILLAVLLKKSNAVEALLECGAELNPIIIKHAVNMGVNSKEKDKIVKIALMIVRSGVDISNFMNDYMKVAMNCVHSLYRFPDDRRIALDLIQELIDRGYDVNRAWYVGRIQGNVVYASLKEQVELLIKNGANPNFDFGGKTPLVQIIQGGHLAAVEFLLDSGADINQKVSGKTPLSHALCFGRNDIIELLIERGASID